MELVVLFNLVISILTLFSVTKMHVVGVLKVVVVEFHILVDKDRCFVAVESVIIVIFLMDARLKIYSYYQLKLSSQRFTPNFLVL